MLINASNIQARVRQTLRRLDTNKDGYLDKHQLKQLLHNLHVETEPKELDRIVNTLATNENGEIAVNEFTNHFLDLIDPLGSPSPRMMNSTLLAPPWEKCFRNLDVPMANSKGVVPEATSGTAYTDSGKQQVKQFVINLIYGVS